ncbi:sulfate transporter [Legionella geestiana]|uniref:Sulfate transporter n=1 Tax=Legionella geestiana TaxID=45065 RepID=A0A0W0TVW1_9GAMM|nr:SulP family inorganic anion transporter [Legionella geestiana]KTC99727.1 sulfate transporter [Legionella geestiana]QBS13151.1 carbonic anhydrase [Legionella geestiana]QDQ39166.1 carbonic anhydrase [Legionella geestiana]STX54331.1 sulfate transporter [Legionella geestiana]
MAFSRNIRAFRIYRNRQFKFDVVAAIVVFLVAIPLCLGIAMASGTPLFSGILSGIVGGIVVGSLSGSPVSVSGPAAGMVAVVLAALAQLGDFNTFLLAVVLAGVFQVLAGRLRAGFFADYVPSNVVQGLLSAIGILLIIKQLPLAFTLSSTLSELKANLLESTGGLAFKPVVDMAEHLNEGACVITFLSFFILIFFDKTRIRALREIPAPIVVVIAGILLNELFLLLGSDLVQETPQLVNIPNNGGITGFLSELTFPNWWAITNPKVWVNALIIAAVASLESLLNVKAGEKLDKKRRYCCKDQELVAQGFGNIVAGLIGGIPVTSVIVRTSVNVQAGAKSKMATVLHGIFILVAVIAIPGVLNKIPLSCLAAILIYTGYKLAKPAIFKSIWSQGLERFIPFIVTLTGIVLTDLLVGILFGLATSLFFILKTNSQARLDIIKEIYPKGITRRLLLPQQITFLNKASLTSELDSLPRRSRLIIDASHTNYIDKEIIELIREFREERAPHKKISMNLVGFKDSYAIHNTIDFINVTTYDVQSSLTPKRVLAVLREGNQRFLHNTRIHRTSQLDIQYTAKAQHPIAVVLGCIDSRVPVETIFDMSFGDLFCVRIAGNVVSPDVLASIEYACEVVGAKLILVLGHTRCGAISAACDGVQAGHITQLLDKIHPAIQAESETLPNARNSQNATFVARVTELNIANTLKHLYEESPILRNLADAGTIGMTGVLYDVNSGEAHFRDYGPDIVRVDGIEASQSAAVVSRLYTKTKP